MLLRLKIWIADILYPEWRRSQLVTSMLEHQRRLRADPVRRRERRAASQSLALLWLGITGALLLVLCAGVLGLPAEPARVAPSPMFARLAAYITVSSAVGFFLVGRPWR